MRTLPVLPNYGVFQGVKTDVTSNLCTFHIFQQEGEGQVYVVVVESIYAIYYQLYCFFFTEMWQMSGSIAMFYCLQLIQTARLYSR